MGVASGCGEQEVGVASGSGCNLWMWLLGVVVRRYIDFLILLIPTHLVSVLFLQQHPYFFFSFFKMFFFLYYLCLNYNIGRYMHIYHQHRSLDFFHEPRELQKSHIYK